jgi:hypothetical protein
MTSHAGRSSAVSGARRALVLLLAALLLGGLSLAPRGVEVTVRNLTKQTLVVRVEAGQSLASTLPIAPRGQGTAVVCPSHDSSIQLSVNHFGRLVVFDLRVYTFHDAIGFASATIEGGDDASTLPRITNIAHDSGYSVWSFLPHGLYARGCMMGLAVGLVAAAWISIVCAYSSLAWIIREGPSESPRTRLLARRAARSPGSVACHAEDRLCCATQPAAVGVVLAAGFSRIS